MADDQKRDIRVGKLESATACHRELARVYREGRNGRISTQDMTRFASTLQVLVGMLRDSELEERMEKLEARLGERR